MAMFDILAEFSDAQPITDTDAQSTDVLDIGENLEDLNFGQAELWLNIKIGTAFLAGTSIVFTLYSHTAATSIQSGTALWTKTVTTGSLTAGAWITRQRLPLNADENRYLGVYYDVTGTMTAGTIDAWLDGGSQTDHPSQKAQSNIT